MNELEQFEDGEDNIVHVTESRRFALLRMMQTTCPVDSNITFLLIQLDRSPCPNNQTRRLPRPTRSPSPTRHVPIEPPEEI